MNLTFFFFSHRSLAHLPNAAHHQLVTQHLALPATRSTAGSTTLAPDEVYPYPAHELERKVDLVVSYISHRIGQARAVGGSAMPISGYEEDWGVRAGAKVGALLCKHGELDWSSDRVADEESASRDCSCGKCCSATSPYLFILLHARRFPWRSQRGRKFRTLGAARGRVRLPSAASSCAVLTDTALHTQALHAVPVPFPDLTRYQDSSVEFRRSAANGEPTGFCDFLLAVRCADAVMS